MRKSVRVIPAALAALLVGLPHHPARAVESWTPAANCASGLNYLSSASDEFDQPLGNRWRIYDVSQGDRSAELAYMPEQVEVYNGVLRLYVRLDQPDDGVNGYPAGAVESNFDIPGATAARASCVEVRTKGFAANVSSPNAWDQNVFSAVWLHDRPASYALNPNPEIDIMEFLQRYEVRSAMHLWHIDSPSDPTPTREHVDHCRTDAADNSPQGPGIDDCHSAPINVGDLTASQHTYGLRREITQINGQTVGLLTFYVDGVTTWTRQFAANDPFVTYPRHVILSTQGNPPGDPGPPFPKVALHAWVRTYN